MRNKKFAIAIVTFTILCIGSIILVNKNDTESTCVLLDKQVEKEWRSLNSASPIPGYLYQAKQNNKWGFIDAKGKYIILPQYDYVTMFSPLGTAICGNYGSDKKNIYAKIIDKNNHILLDGIVLDEYSIGYPGNMHAFDNYFEVFKLKNEKNVIADQTGKVIYSTREELGAYSEGFVAEGHSAYIDVSKLIARKSTFKLVLPKKYKVLRDFSNKYATLLTNNGKTEYIDSKGKIYDTEPKDYTNLSDKNDYIAEELHDNFYALAGELKNDGYKISKQKSNKEMSFGVSTIDDKELLAAKYDDIKYLGEGMFAIGHGENEYRYSQYHTNEFQFIFDARKTKLFKVHYYMLQRYYDGVATASDLKSSFFIDREGNKAKGYPEFNKVGQLTRLGGLIMHKVHGRISYYQKDGKKIYSEKAPNRILKGKIGYTSVSTYRRYDFGLEYPDFYGLSNTQAQKKINNEVKRMNKSIFKSITTNDILWIDYEVFNHESIVTLTQNLLMVKYTVDTNGGGTLCLPYIMSKYFDIRTGQSYNFSSMFKVGIDYKSELVKKILELYDHKKLLSLLWSQENLEVLNAYLLDGNFYIANDGIIISEFPNGSSNYLLSYAKLKIPYDNIMNIIDTHSNLWNSFTKNKTNRLCKY